MARPDARRTPTIGAGELLLASPLTGAVATVEQRPGATVEAGDPLLILEVMKMEHVVAAEVDATVVRLLVEPGDGVVEGQPLAVLRTGSSSSTSSAPTSPPDDRATAAVPNPDRSAPVVDARVEDGARETEPRPEMPSPSAGPGARTTPAPDAAPTRPETPDGTDVRPDLAAVLARHAVGLDPARPEAVAKRHALGRRTARENLDELVDPGSFVEYGPLVFAAQERRRSREDLIAQTPADGIIGGVATINGNQAAGDGRCVVMSYDYTVLAGTQGMRGHLKKDRLFEIAARRRLPVVLFAEGGGGRPGDVDLPLVAGLDCMAFHLFAKLSGSVPTVGIASGRCFAGNAALLGCCDVVIATEDANIGMGGPAMIEGGGLGTVTPEQIGPIDVQAENGVVDLRVADDAAAVAAAKRYLGYFQGPVADWTAPDQGRLRDLIPERRKRIYDVRGVIETLCDVDSVLELRRGFAPGMVTALVRVEGRPLGLVANDPGHLGGAIDAEGTDKAAAFLQLCDAHGLPVLFLCDTPGFMVGPGSEEQAMVRRAAKLFTTGANLAVPTGTIVLRKAYGLGAQAMAGGSMKAPLFAVGWPTSEFGAMGLEGAVRLGLRRELEAIEDPAERQRAYDAAVAAAYEHGQGLNVAAHWEIDDVIDPADSRRWIRLLHAE